MSLAPLVYFRRIENIGHIQQAVFDIAPKSGKQIVAASKENIIAGLSLSTGKISKIMDFYLSSCVDTIDPKHDSENNGDLCLTI